MVIPARDEAGVIATTLAAVCSALDQAGAGFEVIVVDDGSQDATAAIVEGARRQDGRIRLVRSVAPHGFGHAVRAGLEAAEGDAVAVVMADASDDPRDLVRYQALLEEGWDCAFGSRFAGGRRVDGYPLGRLLLNRGVNRAIERLFGHGFDDTTNAFKAYRREVIEGVQPLVSGGFELTAELPLKAIVHGYRFAVIPVSWRGRRTGASKFRITAAGRYGRIVARILLERHRRTPVPRRI